MRSDHVDEGKVDAAASEACARSGTFALLLSVSLLLLIPYWQEQPNYDALRRYVGNRNNLALEVDQLNDDPYWQKYRASHGNTDAMSIAALLTESVPYIHESAESFKVQPQSEHGVEHKPANPLEGLPTPPTFHATAQVNIKLDRIRNIANLLGELNDSLVLTRTRRVSNFFDFSIVQWIQKRNTLAYRNQIVNNCFKGQLEKPDQKRISDDFVPALQEEGILNCLTLRDVQELAQLALPVFSAPELGEHIGKQIEISPGSLPRDPFMATFLAQILLFFAMMHFGAFSREAVSSPNFPAPGTLFRAFKRSRFSLFIYFVATCLPVLVSVALLWFSVGEVSLIRRVGLLTCTLLISSAFLTIQVIFWRSAYFTIPFASSGKG